MCKKSPYRRGILAALCLCLGLTLTLSPAAAFGEEIAGREYNNFSGTLIDGAPAEHRVFVGVRGTTTLSLSFIGGNSSILLEIFDSNNKRVYQKRTATANKFMIDHLEVGSYLLRLTPAQKIPRDLPYQLEVLMPKTTYVTFEEESAPLAAPGEALTDDTAGSGLKPIPFSVYIVFMVMLFWGWLSFWVYRTLKGSR
ncbi:MAG: T9SS type A sorting domain-containing protein [Peptococcaceae bacterium]|nr:T9SS type A sorting domain-containing protein [Peptococcaceae bacterium]